jgi:hypothetical protein
VRDLATAIESAPYSETKGFGDAVAEVLVAIRELDAALPDYETDAVVEPPALNMLERQEAACAPPIQLPLESARELAVMAMGHSRALDGLIPDALKATPAELRGPTVRKFGQVMGRLYTEIMRPLHIQHNELEVLVLGTGEEQDDHELDDQQRAVVAKLTAEEISAIDTALLTHVTDRWRKVAFVVAKAMSSLGDARISGVPDIYYAERVRVLADGGVIESVGDLRRMRFSEIRKRGIDKFE